MHIPKLLATTTTSLRTASPHLSKVRGVEQDAHQHTGESTSDGDGHDPGEHEQAHSLPVDGLERAVAETYTDCRTGDAHGGGDGELELRE